MVAGHKVGVAVREEGRVLYRHDAKQKRIPASNQKLLLSMALLDAVGPEFSIHTSAAAVALEGPVVAGDLWVLGHGDPSLSVGGRYARTLPLEPTRIASLARAIKDAGVERVEGGVRGSTSYFRHDWFAPGWRSYYPARYCPLPSALAFNGNSKKGRHFSNPEFRVARALTKRLESIGVSVLSAPDAGPPPRGLQQIARVASVPLSALLRHVNRNSSNFFAEVLGKRLGVERYGRPGTIAKGARAITSWARGRGAPVTAYDASGLSYANRVAPLALARLLDRVEDEPWGQELRASLPKADQGTLEDRLHGVRVRAKTGSLDQVSALSGWVFLKQTRTWAEFSILSSGMPKSTAASIEDRIVRTVRRSAS